MDASYIRRIYSNLTGSLSLNSTKNNIHSLDIAESTLNKWKQNVGFSESLKDAKERIDRQVENSLLSRALGAEVIETKKGIGKHGLNGLTITRRLPPDPAACIFWLKNRQPHRWSEKIQEAANHTTRFTVIIQETNCDHDKLVILSPLPLEVSDAVS